MSVESSTGKFYPLLLLKIPPIIGMTLLRFEEDDEAHSIWTIMAEQALCKRR